MVSGTALSNGMDEDDHVKASAAVKKAGPLRKLIAAEQSDDSMDSDPGSSDVEGDDEVQQDEECPSSADESDQKEKLSGWADAMAKVLNTGKSSNKSACLLLSKAKPHSAVGEGGPKVRKETAVSIRRRKKELDSIGRAKPNVLGRNKEKALSRLATKGVVQLFNAVRDHQQKLKGHLQQVGRSTRKREAVFKKVDQDAFLHKLNTLSSVPAPPTDESWKILRDDYMMGARMKDWDKDQDSD